MGICHYSHNLLRLAFILTDATNPSSPSSSPSLLVFRVPLSVPFSVLLSLSLSPSPSFRFLLPSANTFFIPSVDINLGFVGSIANS